VPTEDFAVECSNRFSLCTLHSPLST
jgi:hypothetical protein